MRRIALFLLIGCFVAALGSCTMDELDTAFDNTSSTIVNGTEPTEPYQWQTVSLHQKIGNSVYGYYCSGTYLGHNTVLTAGHCVENNGRVMSAGKLLIYFAVNDNGPANFYDGVFYSVSQIQLNPNYGWRWVPEVYGYVPTNDIALVRLGTTTYSYINPRPPLPAGVPPLPADEGFVSADIGHSLNFAGWGEDYNAGTPDGTLLQWTGHLSGISSDWPEIRYEQEAGGPCFGDSGGPAFLDRDGTIYVGGITSWGDDYCADYGWSTRVDAFEQFICDFTPDFDMCEVVPPDCSSDGWCNPECEVGADPDCTIPDCAERGDPCTTNSDCCSNRCDTRKNKCR